MSLNKNQLTCGFVKEFASPFSLLDEIVQLILRLSWGVEALDRGVSGTTVAKVTNSLRFSGDFGFDQFLARVSVDLLLTGVATLLVSEVTHSSRCFGLSWINPERVEVNPHWWSGAASDIPAYVYWSAPNCADLLPKEHLLVIPAIPQVEPMLQLAPIEMQAIAIAQVLGMKGVRFTPVSLPNWMDKQLDIDRRDCSKVLPTYSGLVDRIKSVVKMGSDEQVDLLRQWLIHPGTIPSGEDWIKWFNAIILEGLHYAVVSHFSLPLDNPEALIIQEQLATISSDPRLTEIATCLALSLAYHLEQGLLGSYGCRLRFLHVPETTVDVSSQASSV
jgi:hypothetical protein